MAEEEKIEAEMTVPGTEAATGNEKREFPRVPMNLQVRYRQLDSEEAARAMGRVFNPDELLGDFGEGETKNVSKNGILLYTNEEIPAKSFLVVNMYITIPGITANCKALAEVIRRDRANDASKWLYTVALKFHKIMHHNLKNYRFLDLNNLLDVKEAGN